MTMDASGPRNPAYRRAPTRTRGNPAPAPTQKSEPRTRVPFTRPGGPPNSSLLAGTDTPGPQTSLPHNENTTTRTKVPPTRKTARKRPRRHTRGLTAPRRTAAYQRTPAREHPSTTTTPQHPVRESHSLARGSPDLKSTGEHRQNRPANDVRSQRNPNSPNESPIRTPRGSPEFKSTRGDRQKRTADFGDTSPETHGTSRKPQGRPSRADARDQDHEPAASPARQDNPARPRRPPNRRHRRHTTKTQRPVRESHSHDKGVPRFPVYRLTPTKPGPWLVARGRFGLGR
jgi:hypothetical protein